MADVTSSGSTTNDQVNSTGSNTAITGGYSSTATTNYQDGSSSNTTTNNTTNAYQGDSRVVPSASAPSISAMSQDLCTVGISAGGQSFSFGASVGMTKRDMNCERLKLAKSLHDMGMKVAAIGIMCQDSRVFSAMSMAGTYCPYNGKIGLEAKMDMTRMANQQLITNMAQFAEIEREMIMSRLNGGKIVYAEKGYSIGGQTPFGYTKEYDGSGSRRRTKLIPVPEEQEVLKHIYALRDKG